MSVWSTISLAIQTRVPIILWGEPGVGKTARIEQLCQSLRLPYEVVIASIREPSDFGGLPVKVDLAARDNPDDVWSIGGTMVALAPPNWAVRLHKNGGGVLILDELSCAPPAVQAATLRVVNEGFVGDLELPPISIVACANPPEIAAGGWELPAPQANRFAHVDVGIEHSSWINWALGAPDNITGKPARGWESHVEPVLAHLAAFVQAYPQVLQNMPAAESARGRAWPSGRTWELAGRLIAGARAVGYEDTSEVTQEAVAAVVGDGAAVSFIEWSKNLDLPNPEDLLAHPKRWSPPPHRGDIAFAALSAMVQAVRANTTKNRWISACQVLAHVGTTGGQPDAIIPFARILGSSDLRQQASWNYPTDFAPLVPILKESGYFDGN